MNILHLIPPEIFTNIFGQKKDQRSQKDISLESEIIVHIQMLNFKLESELKWVLNAFLEELSTTNEANQQFDRPINFLQKSSTHLKTILLNNAFELSGQACLWWVSLEKHHYLNLSFQLLSFILSQWLESTISLYSILVNPAHYGRLQYKFWYK